MFVQKETSEGDKSIGNITGDNSGASKTKSLLLHSQNGNTAMSELSSFFIAFLFHSAERIL